MNIVGELAIVRSAVSRMAERVRRDEDTSFRDLGNELTRLHRTFDRHLAQMQNGILEVRMVPLGQVFDKLARVVRQISREHDKQVNFVVTGAETEIDKLIVEELSDPLMHMIRNAIDHGIEDRDERMRVQKPAVGTIALNAFQKGNHVVIEVEDDGRGMDTSQILNVAMRRGMVNEAEARELGEKDILAFVFQPGFTTKEEATTLSGRGVGMDIVRTNIGRLGGVVDISSEVGIGTKMTITLPITLAIISVLMLEVAGRTFCMPLASVEEAIVFDESDGEDVRRARGHDPARRHAADRAPRQGVPARGPSRRDLGERRAKTPKIGRRTFGGAATRYVVIAAVADRRVGFVVDRLIGQQDIVIKALGKSLKKVRGLAGATELGNQQVGLVLDAASLIDEVLASRVRIGSAARAARRGARGIEQGLLARRGEARSAMQRADEIGKRAEYLAFRLGGEAYAIEIGNIVEILRPLPITEVPRADPDVVGVMSVRGRLVAVVDLKRRFKMANAKRGFAMDKKSRILLVDAIDEEIGLLVDEVLQVYRLSESEIEPPTVLGSEQAPHVVGIGRPAPVPGQPHTVLMLIDLVPIFGE